MRQLILNVDDFEAQRYLRSSILRRAGYDVVDASSGQEALELARERRPDLILLDVHLPDIGGLEVCRQLKADTATARILVLHVSATFRDSASRITALDNGADAYLAEPVEADVLVAEVRALLRLAAAEAKAQRSERALEEGEARYRRLFEHMTEGFFLAEIVHDESGRAVDYRYLDANPAFERLTGLPRAQVLGRTLRQVLPTAEDYWLEAYARVAESGEPAVLEHFAAPLGRHYSTVAYSPAPNRFACLFSDVTERRRREEENRQQRELLSAIIDNIPVLLVIWDPSLQSFRFNAAMRSVLGWTEADTVDGKFMERAYPDPEYRQAVTEYMLSLQPGWRDLKTTAKDGRVVDISWANVTIPGGTSIGIGVDVSERKRIEAERALIEIALRDANARLEEADRRKDEFIAVLSHELRNPLAPIRYAIPIIEQQGASGPAARALAVIDRQTAHLTRLVDDLLDLSRITSGTIALRKDYVTLASVVSAAIEAASASVAAGRHTLRVHVPEEPLWLYADAARLAQVITNLLDNSAKYTTSGGDIALEATPDDGEVVIRVRDNGMGIPPGELPFVFEMFRRVHRPEQQAGGLGIGLALSKRLVDDHGGRIEAHSEGAGRGTEIVLRLPLAPEGRAEDAGPKNGTNGRETRRLKVLVVDDNVDLVEMLSMVVEGAGHEVRKAFDGKSAVSAALSYQPDVLLLDLGLPGMSGLDVARELRRRADLAGLHIVALTGLGQPEDRCRTEDAGFDYHLTKPTTPDEVEELLDRFAASLLR